jgi:hypothetical protein
MHNSDILKYIYDKAKSRFDGDEALAEQMMNGFITKTAATLNSYMKGTNTDRAPNFPSSFAKGLAESAGRTAVGGVATLGLLGISALANSIREDNLHRKFMIALNEATQTNRVLKAADKNKVINFAETIFKFAPNVASDANLLGSILSNAIHGDSIDPMTVRTLTELESRYRDTTGFDPKRFL